MKISQKIGNRIRQARLNKRLTQTALAKMLNITNGAISSYEMGDTLPSVTVAIDLSKILDTSLDWLFLGADMESRDEKRQEFTEEEIKLLMAFRRMSKNNQKLMLSMADTLPQAYDRISPKADKDKL